MFDLIIVGGGASGIIAAIFAAGKGRRVLLLEKLGSLAAKLSASGGGRCNLANTLCNERFIDRFGRTGRFMIPALSKFGAQDLCAFFSAINVKTHALDGFRIFPVGHRSKIVTEALLAELQRLNVAILTSKKVDRLLFEHDQVKGVGVESQEFYAAKVLVATGGRGYPLLGGGQSGYDLARQAGHKIVETFPAMLPLNCKEQWVANCRADTIGKAVIRINIPGYEKIKATGDLIFTTNGIRGPLVLDFAREITPLLDKYGEVPVLLNLVGGLNEQQVYEKLRELNNAKSNSNIGALVKELLPEPLALEVCRQVSADSDVRLKHLPGKVRERLFKTLAATPLTITGHAGFDQAMVTRGGVSLKQVNPMTLESRKVKGLFFSGEVLDLDGPCGGFNLQWAFASGHLAGTSAC